MMTDTKKKLLLTGIQNGNYPQVLYKYRTIDQTKAILENFSFWFATPDSFNDPFDCNLSECQTPSAEDALQYLKSLGTIKPSQLQQSASLFQRKPEEIIDLVNNTKQKTINNKGVFSLSKKHDDILMWSHYADYHKGVVLGLDLSSDLGFFLDPIIISYQDTYNELNYFKNPKKSINDTLRIKSLQWAYEQEVRVYKKSHGLHEIHKDAIKEVYFGINSTQEDINEMRQLFSDKKLSNVRFFKGEKAHASFKIEFSPLS